MLALKCPAELTSFSQDADSGFTHMPDLESLQFHGSHVVRVQS